MVYSLDDQFFNMIVCPFISSPARKRLDKKLARMTGYKGEKALVFSSRMVPGDTSNMVDFLFEPEGDITKRTTISSVMRMMHGNITWVFEHKMADEVSIPVCMFNSPRPVNVVGRVRVVNMATG